MCSPLNNSNLDELEAVELQTGLMGHMAPEPGAAAPDSMELPRPNPCWYLGENQPASVSWKHKLGPFLYNNTPNSAPSSSRPDRKVMMGCES